MVIHLLGIERIVGDVHDPPFTTGPFCRRGLAGGGWVALDDRMGAMDDVDIDFPRMRRARRARLREAMAAQGFDAVVLLGPSNQEYAGVAQPCADAMRMHYESVVVIVDADR